MQRWLIFGAVLAALGALLYLHLELESEEPAPRAASGEPGGTPEEDSRRWLPGESSLPEDAASSDPARAAPAATQASGASEEDAPDLPGTFSLWGLVTDESGQPLEGVRVRAKPGDNSPVETRGKSETDAQGRFRLRSLLPGHYDLSFTRDRFLRLKLESWPLPPHPPPLTVTLQPAFILQGRVVDARGTPLPGVDVDLYEIERVLVGMEELSDTVPRGQAPAKSEERAILMFEAGTQTQPDGTFILDTPRPGTWLLRAHPQGFSPIAREVTSPAKDVWLVVGAGASVEVAVVDDQERPMPHARVGLWRTARDETFTVQLTTDEAGRGVLQGLEAGEYGLVATPPAPEDLRMATASVTLRGEQLQQVRLRLGAGARLSGVVTDPAGRPLSGVEVQARLPPIMSLEEKLPPLPASALPPGVDPQQPASWITFLERLGRERLLAEHRVRTGPDGRFTVPNLLPISYRLSFVKQGYTLVQPPETPQGTRRIDYLDAPANQDSLRVVMSYQGRVSGRVVRAVDGEPLSTFQINGDPYTSPDGTFTLTAGEPGPHTLELLVPEVGGLHRKYETRLGEDVDLGDLVVGDGRAVRVRVEDSATSLPLARVQLELRELPSDGELPREVDTDPQELAPQEERHPLAAVELGLSRLPRTAQDGLCHLPDVPARPLVLSASRKGYEPLSTRLGPQEQELTLRLRAWATVQGWVRVQGEPIAKGEVNFYAPDGSFVEDLEVRNGWYSGHLLRPGRYLARAECESCPKPEPVFVARFVDVPGPRETLPLDFQEAQGATVEVFTAPEVRGLILVQGQHPLPTSDQRQALARGRHPSERLEGGAKGYRFRDVPAGRYTLLFFIETDDEQDVPSREEVEVPTSGLLSLQVPRGAPQGQEEAATGTGP